MLVSTVDRSSDVHVSSHAASQRACSYHAASQRAASRHDDHEETTGCIRDACAATRPTGCIKDACAATRPTGCIRDACAATRPTGCIRDACAATRRDTTRPGRRRRQTTTDSRQSSFSATNSTSSDEKTGRTRRAKETRERVMHHADGNMQMQHSSTQTRHARRRHNEERRAHARRIMLDHSGSRRITLDCCGGSRRDRGGSHVGIMVDHAQGSPSNRVWIMQLDPTAGSQIGAQLDHGSQGAAGSRITGRGWIMDHRGSRRSWIADAASRIADHDHALDRGCIADRGSDHASWSRIMHRGRGSSKQDRGSRIGIADHAASRIGQRDQERSGAGSQWITIGTWWITSRSA